MGKVVRERSTFGGEHLVVVTDVAARASRETQPFSRFVKLRDVQLLSKCCATWSPKYFSTFGSSVLYLIQLSNHFSQDESFYKVFVNTVSLAGSLFRRMQVYGGCIDDVYLHILM